MTNEHPINYSATQRHKCRQCGGSYIEKFFKALRNGQPITNCSFCEHFTNTVKRNYLEVN